jgi:glucose-1-phosphate cytidylyltransferase
MKAVILAGGYGSRLSEETTIRPKPMVEIGGMPILWHIMKIYSMHGINDFIICCGYKGHLIKEYFWKFFLYNSDVTFDLMRPDGMQIHRRNAEPWKVTLIDTGEKTLKGGRIRRVRDHIGQEPFCLTYGDGVSDINIRSLIDFHQSHDGLATLTAVQTHGRFGAFRLHEGQTQVCDFREKTRADGAWINGGFFVLDPRVIDYIPDDSTDWEHGPLEELSRQGRLYAYKHAGFWHPMDTLNDKNALEEMWQSGQAPWKVW